MKSTTFSRLAVICTFVVTNISASYAAPPSPLEGRWDMTITMGSRQLPSWLEIQHSGLHTLVGRFVYAGGSARSISKINVHDGKFSFAIPPQWEDSDRDLQFEGRAADNTMSGSMTFIDGKTYPWTAVRAPSLRRSGEPEWGQPITLFGGTDMTAWHAMGEHNQWIVEEGIMRSPKSGSNLVTNSSFTDFKLHIEFRYQKGSNSGVYLRGRYEVQVMDSKGEEPTVGTLGAVYGFLPPNEQVAGDAGEWQKFDITLVGRRVTVVANGKTIISDQEIPGITGGAIDSHEGEPGPIMLQGDHGPIDYQNITITPAH
jgi:hypothetical protein